MFVERIFNIFNKFLRVGENTLFLKVCSLTSSARPVENVALIIDHFYSTQ